MMFFGALNLVLAECTWYLCLYYVVIDFSICIPLLSCSCGALDEEVPTVDRKFVGHLVHLYQVTICCARLAGCCCACAWHRGL